VGRRHPVAGQVGRRHPVAAQAERQTLGAGRRLVAAQVDLQARAARLRRQPVAPHRGQARPVVAAMRARAAVDRAVQIQKVELMVLVRAIPDLATQRVVTFHFPVSLTKSLPTVAVPRPRMRKVLETQDQKGSRGPMQVQAGKARAPQQRKPRRVAARPAARARKTAWSPTGVPLTR
jgi:hypothetical protein